MIEKKLESQEKIQSIFHLLKLLQKEIKLEKSLVREIKREVKSYEEEEEEGNEEKKQIPQFNGVLKRDVENLMYEAYEDELKGVEFFEKKDKWFCIEFAINMKKESYIDEQRIYEKDETANFFYVIKKGSVEFCLPEETRISFMECHNGYFGEFELIENKPRMYTVRCLENTEILKISKIAFFEIFLEKDQEFKKDFEEVTKQRKRQFEEAFNAVRKLTHKCLEEIKLEFMKKNPFYIFQLAVRSEKFAIMLEGEKKLKNRENKKLTKKEKKEFFALQEKIKNEYRQKKLDEENKQKNESEENNQQYHVSNSISAQLRRKQAIQNKTHRNSRQFKRINQEE